MTDHVDPATWLPLEGLQPGFDAYRAPHTEAFAGRGIDLDVAGAPLSLAFDRDELVLNERPPMPYRAFAVADELSYVQLQTDDSAISLVVDDAFGWATIVTTTIGGGAPGLAAADQRFEVVALRPDADRAARPDVTDELLGRRVVWHYSPVHSYEHVYLSPQWFTWHCLAGPEQGLADTDQCTTFQLRPGIYLFAWREKVIDCASVTIADHRSAHALRSHGVLFGTEQGGQRRFGFTFGARGTLASVTHLTADDGTQTSEET